MFGQLINPEYRNWTPIIGGATSESGQAYDIQVGLATKIGKQVWFQFAVRLTNAGTITGDIRIKGFPWASINLTNAYSAPGAIFFDTLATNWIALSGFFSPNGTEMGITGRQSAGVSHTNLAPADIANTTFLIGSGTYRAGS